MARRLSPQDVVAASSGKLEPFPVDSLPGEETGLKLEGGSEEEWLEVMKERADRGEQSYHEHAVPEKQTVLYVCFAVSSEPGVQFSLGQYYFTKKDYSNALKYFEKAASVRRESGTGTNHFSLQAKYQLGVMYFDGLGVPVDPVSLTSPAPPPLD